MNRICYVLLALLVCALLAVPARAEEVQEAADISGEVRIVSSNIEKVESLFDGDQTKAVKLDEAAAICLEHEGGIGSAYLIFDLEYGAFTITDQTSGESREFGSNALVHEFADIEGAFGYAPKKIEIAFENGAGQINELFLFAPGTPPDWVQRWQLPKDGETDLVLFSTHCDDEQLFFAGLLPYYAKEMGYQCQVVFFTGHRNVNTLRVHEMLDGLWAVGIDTYPVIGQFPDQFSESRRDAYGLMASVGITDDELLGFVVDNLRRFKPLVAVGHDLGGEYGHGQHMMYADLLTRAIEITDDPEAFPESARQYGTWDVPKTYLHLYTKNRIYMDWDQPLESFDGMTAFLVSKELGFSKHVSQQLNFGWFIHKKETAASINYCSPSRYGLYRSTVGADVQKNDMFENLIPYAQQRAEEEAIRQAEEEAARQQEQARLEAEAEAKRLEEEQLAREEAERAAAEAEQRKAQEEAALQEQQQRKASMLRWGLTGLLTILVLFGAGIVILERKNKFEKK